MLVKYADRVKEADSRRAAWLVIGLGLTVRLLISSQFLLTPDEANYWQWSRYIDIGYHDHPPMIAWTIRLTTVLFGQSELAVRLPTVLGMTTASIYLSLLAARWFSWRTALHTALLSQAVLLLNGAALIATPDGLLLACWAAACYHAARSLEEDTFRQWLLTGIWFGLGLLSKYTMLLFLPSFFFSMVFISAYRKRLLTRKPWLGLLAGLLLFTPVVLWNSRNDWATFRHVLFQGGVDNTAFFTLRYTVDFLGSQAALLSPIIFLFILASWLKGWRRDHPATEKKNFFLWMSLTGFAAFSLLAFHVRIYGNWPAPAYLTALVLIAALYSPGQRGTGRQHRFWNFGIGLAFFLSGAIMLQLVCPVLPVPAKLDRTAKETKGWDKLAKKMDQAYRGMEHSENTFIFGLRYQFASELAFYMQGQPRTVSINRWSRPNVYDFWFDDKLLIGMNGIGVFEHRGMDTVLTQVFERVEPAEKITLYRESPWFGREPVRLIYLVRCYGFKGGLRWQPKEVGDIRAAGKG